ncbi:MAG: PilN domain-containing protein [Gammaproteobacteria bacterium]|nr:PilN domain-containing protein [Gammaproteobacteria bacterium]
MNQQINLFQPIFRKARTILSFAALFQVNIIFIVALSLLFSFNVWKEKQLRLELNAFAVQHHALVAQVDKLRDEAKKLKEEYYSENQLALLKAEISAYDYIFQTLGSEFSNRTVGFSIYFETFSRQVIKGLWITGFSVSQGGKVINITGGALKPEMVPQFINRLSTEPGLSGINFSVLHLDRKEQQRQWLEFFLSSKEEMDSDTGS